LSFTQDLVPGDVDFSFINDNTDKKHHLDKLTKVSALKIDNKTIVIKGFTENADVDSELLKTIDLSSKNIDTVATSSFGIDIVPVTIDMAFADDVTQLTGDKEISEYQVVQGDTLSSIADKNNISVNTILWANDLNSKSSIKVGQKLVILPVSGVSYTVKKGDHLSGLAKRFNTTEKNITDFNKIADDTIVVGEVIVIPGAKVEVIVTKPKTIVNKKGQKTVINDSISTSSHSPLPSISGLIKPINAIKTQGLHGHNAIDFGAPVGTTVVAALDGVVTLTRGGDTWNGGYGNYIVLKHEDGVQTLYAHLSQILVDADQTVTQGQVIGKSGNTGDSTGPHLHFEVRGARNPF
jgi:murein DD-endopeptidase MepM/ murein hydrolase activator NlpD